MRKLLFITSLVLVLGCSSKKAEEYSKITENPAFIHEAYEKLTDVIIHDIFSPPVSSRIYAYASIAGYEALVAGSKDYASLSGQLHGLSTLPKPEEKKEYCYPLASVKAIMTIARTLTFTVEKYDEFEKLTYQKFKDAGVPSDVYDRSMALGEGIGKAVIDYSKKDNYLQTRGLRYTVKTSSDKWVPTPPQYADAMEPYWRTIRTMVMDSASQFPAKPVIPFSKDKTSPYWKELVSVYETVNGLTQEQKDIAWFWDDNAFVMNVQGHVMYANKKMTPAGHWMAITRTACQQTNKSINEAADAYLRVAISLHEAFISSWDEKYKSEKIRPETVINAEIDPKWAPFLQTPPFPEYTSGHSTISAASAEALTFLFGDNIAFVDSTEYKYDHGVRKFESFRKAAEECSISRVYGGIHYLSGCKEGGVVGTQIGQFVSARLTTRKNSLKDSIKK
jgi:PAP2 superfamily